MPGKTPNEKRNNLAEYTEYDKEYIDVLMTSIQEQRHSSEWLKSKGTFTELKLSGNLLGEFESKERAKNLIHAFVKYIQKKT